MSAQNRKRGVTPGRDRARDAMVRSKRSLDETDSIEVFCRMCPYHGSNPSIVAEDESSVRTVAPPTARGSANSDKIYTFNTVFGENDGQEAVFNRTAADLVNNLMSGHNSLLFTYGVTGSGKTYTMTGNPTAKETGLLPRTLDVVFNSIQNRLDKCVFFPSSHNTFDIRSTLEAHVKRRQLDADKLQASREMQDRYVERLSVGGYNENYVCSVFVSYVEIYNNNCFDLLEETKSQTLTKCDLRQDKAGQIYVDGAKDIEVESADDALEMFCRGEERRRVSCTLLNKDSSRSHSVFTVKLVLAPRQYDNKVLAPVDDPAQIVVSHLCLVDLAGSERAKRTLNVGDRLAEASSINQSLMVLRHCIEALRKNQRTTGSEAVPYRSSKLTHLFKNYLEGNGKIRMIVCVNPKPEDYDENLTALAFAEESQAVEVKKQGDKMATDRVPHRWYSGWTAEMDEFARVVNDIRSETPVPPGFSLRDYNDTTTIDNLRRYFRLVNKDAEAASTEAVMSLLRQTLMENDFAKDEITKLKKALDEKEGEAATLKAHVLRYKREVASLRERVSRYEADDEEKNAEMERIREEQMQERNLMLKQKKAMKKVAGIIENNSPSVAALRSRFDVENTPPRSALKKVTTTTETHVVTSSSSSNDLRRMPSAAVGTPGHNGYFNPKYHRRSKSASRILDHQPAHRVPTGGIMQTRMPSNAIRVTKPELKQLNKSSDYVLTHQEVDNDGNISTNIVKTGVSMNSASIAVFDDDATSTTASCTHF